MGKIHRALLFLNVTRPIRFFGVLHHFYGCKVTTKFLTLANFCSTIVRKSAFYTSEMANSENPKRKKSASGEGNMKDL